MSITLNTKTYTLDASIDGNRNRYTGPAHTITTNDYFDVSRAKTPAKGDFIGQARAGIKTVKTVTISGSQYDIIIETTVRAPLGVAQADLDSARDDHGDLLVSTTGADLFYKHDISF